MFDRRFRIQKMSRAAKIARTIAPMPTPTPMPILEPSDSPPDAAAMVEDCCTADVVLAPEGCDAADVTPRGEDEDDESDVVSAAMYAVAVVPLPVWQAYE